MPQVPVYQRQVASRGFQAPEARSVRANIGDEVSNIFNQARGALGEADKFYQREREKADRMAVMGAQEELDDFNSKYFNGDGESTGAFARKGEDSFGINEEYDTAYKSKYDEINKRLNENQKLAFDEYARKRKLQSDDDIRKHTSREIVNYNNGKLKSRVAGLQDRVRNDAYDINKIRENLTEQNKAIFQLADANGLSKEETDNMILEANSRTHRTVMNTYLSKNEDILAGEYLKKVREQMTSDDLAMVERSLEETSTLAKSQRLSSEILAKGLDDTTSIAEARKIEDPKLQDMVVSRVKNQLNEQRQAHRQTQEDIYTDLFFQMAEEGKSFDDLDKEQKLLLTPERYKSLAHVGMKGTRQESDVTAYQDFLAQAYTTETRDKFLQMDAKDFAKKLTVSDTKKMIDLQNKIRNKEVDEFEAQGFLSDRQYVKNSLEELKIKKKEDQAKFYSYVDTEKRKWEQENKRKMNREEFEKLVNTSLISGEVKRKGFFSFILPDPDKRVYELEEGEIQNFEVDDKDSNIKYKEIVETKKLQRTIENELKRRGQPVSQEYVKGLMQVIRKK